MSRPAVRLSFLPLLFLALPACGGNGQPDPAEKPGQPATKAAANKPSEATGTPDAAQRDTPWAESLELVAPLPTLASPFHSPEIVVAESWPLQFDLNLTHAVPSPAWQLLVEELSPAKDGRIEVRLHEKAPADPDIQVLTDKRLRLPLGSLKKGKLEVVLLLRRDADTKHERVQSLELRAK